VNSRFSGFAETAQLGECDRQKKGHAPANIEACALAANAALRRKHQRMAIVAEMATITSTVAKSFTRDRDFWSRRDNTASN